MEANTPLHLFLHSTLHTLIGLYVITLPDIIIHRHYNVRIRAIARARVCVCVERLQVVQVCKFPPCIIS